jgi:hypothetical protein
LTGQFADPQFEPVKNQFPSGDGREGQRGCVGKIE